MESRQTFLDSIQNYYIKMSDGKVPFEFINELSEVVTDYYYEQYSRFGKQYPKSAKRYSSFQLKDLSHPETFEMVIKYFKEKTSERYREFSRQLLNISEEELSRFEKNREEFYKLW
jgi:hypothetical protein